MKSKLRGICRLTQWTGKFFDLQVISFLPCLIAYTTLCKCMPNFSMPPTASYLPGGGPFWHKKAFSHRHRFWIVMTSVSLRAKFMKIPWRACFQCSLGMAASGCLEIQGHPCCWDTAPLSSRNAPGLFWLYIDVISVLWLLWLGDAMLWRWL